jgi:diguanylate cyclase (GGDEF)-like protein
MLVTPSLDHPVSERPFAMNTPPNSAVPTDLVLPEVSVVAPLALASDAATAPTSSSPSIDAAAGDAMATTDPAAPTPASTSPGRWDSTRLDALTGLPNRVCFTEQLHRAVDENRPAGPMLALLFFDLDGFKFVNDSLGHQAGDELLIQVGERLNRILVDPAERLFRLAGDEFVIVANRVERLNQLPKLAERILAEFQDPFIVTNEKAFVGASIGIAIRSNQGQNAERLLHEADAAMYQSKRNGRRCYSFYSADLDQEHRRLFQLRGDIRDAIDQQEFSVHYQPVFDLATGQRTGAEALVRWFRNGQPYCQPEEFVREAEKCGLIVPMSQQVIRQVSRDLLAWKANGHPLLPVSINISASHFRFGDLQDDLASAFLFQGLPSQLIEIELSEEAVLHDVKQSRQKIQALQQMGFRVVVDDLGTGRSSIAYLQKVPVDAVKIDASFINDIENSDFALAVVESMIRIAHTRSLRVVAEGVESAAIQQRLCDLGCDQAQGFWLGRPCPAAEFYGAGSSLSSDGNPATSM